MPAKFLHALILAAAVFLLYRPSLDYGFVWDDQIYIVQNPAVQDWSYAADAFTSPNTTWSANPEYNISEWRPLRNISYLIDHSIYGLNPMGWHLTNILLHAAATVLLYLLIRRLIHLCVLAKSPSHFLTFSQSRMDLAALAGAAFWAVHPVQTEVVAWVKSRDDLLATCFFFGALLMALPKTRDMFERPEEGRVDARSTSGLTGSEASTEKRQQATALQTRATPPTGPGSGSIVGPGVQGAALSVLFFVCALLSKEHTIILAGFYPIILLLLSQRPLRLRVKDFTFSHSHILTFSLISTALAYLAIHHTLLGRTAQASHPGDSPLLTVLTMLHAFTRYIQLIVWPWPPTLQSADYDSYPIITNPLNPRAIIGLVSLLFFLFLFFVSSRLRVKVLLQTGIALFLLALLPYSNIIPMMQILAERFLYLPLVGIAITLSSFLLLLYSLCESSRLCAFASKFLSILIIICLAYQTHLRLPVWQSDFTLFSATRAANPTSWRPADLYIKALLSEGRMPAAVDAAEEALAQFPRDPDIVRTAAVTHLLAGNETSGTALTDYAVWLQPNDWRASNTLEKWRQMQR